MKFLSANDQPGQHAPSWYAATAPSAQVRPPLHHEMRVDVCVIGAGLTGLSSALHLAEAGLSVCVLEAHRIGWGASGRNGGQVGDGFSTDPRTLEKRYGRSTADLLWSVGQRAVDTVTTLIEKHRIDCEWQPGILACQYRPRQLDDASALLAFLADRHGYTGALLQDARQTAQQTGTDCYAGSVYYADSGHLHPLKLVQGLAQAAQRAGAAVFEQSKVVSVRQTRQAMTVTTDHATVHSDFAVLGCNGYLDDLEPAITRRVMPINNFIVVTAPLTDDVPPVLPSGRAVYDSKFVVNYFRRTPDNRLLFGGGENYRYRFPRDIRALVGRPLSKIYPQLDGIALDHAWGGTLAITRSRLPYFYRNGRMLSVSGYSGHGVAMAVLAGRLMADAIRTREATEFTALSRIPAKRFPGNNNTRAPLLAAAMSWYALLDRLN